MVGVFLAGFSIVRIGFLERTTEITSDFISFFKNLVYFGLFDRDGEKFSSFDISDNCSLLRERFATSNSFQTRYTKTTIIKKIIYLFLLNVNFESLIYFEKIVLGNRDSQNKAYSTNDFYLASKSGSL